MLRTLFWMVPMRLCFRVKRQRDFIRLNQFVRWIKLHVHTEDAIDYRSVVSTRRREKHGNMTEAIGQAAAYTALNLKVKAVLAPTQSGHTAKMIAKYRPGCPVIALTSSEE